MAGASGRDAAAGRMPDPAFWSGKKVLLTGHRSLQGSWLGLWLSRMGAELFGYGAGAMPLPSLHSLAGIDRLYPSALGDIRDETRLTAAMTAFSPDVVFHLAAQPPFLGGCRGAVETLDINAVGTARLLDAVLRTGSVRAVIAVASDKGFFNPGGPNDLPGEGPHRAMDPYSAGKTCAELVTAAYRRSFFGPGGHPAAVATARAGSVIGGGDFAEGRLAPDAVRAWRAGREPRLRLPGAVRPWQHVLEPLAGCLRLAEELWTRGDAFAEPWHFGPPPAHCRTAGWLAAELTAALRGQAEGAACSPPAGRSAPMPMPTPELREPGEGAERGAQESGREAFSPRLDSSKAEARLGWRSRWPVEEAARRTAEWYRAWAYGEELRSFSLQQLDSYVATPIAQS